MRLNPTTQMYDYGYSSQKDLRQNLYGVWLQSSPPAANYLSYSDYQHY